ncbi:MAG: hypothetical protein K1X94_32720 [Sandaracinaceae bacterium]|nr:hypothetical protein [Sandaracinaceae bacterium]
MKTKIAYAAGLLTTSLGALALAGCPTDPPPADAAMADAPIVLPDDAGNDSGIRRDTGPTGDTGPTCGTRGHIGGACAAAECFEGLCQEEISREVPSVMRSDFSMAGRPYPVRYYVPGGQCQLACDPNRSDQCNACSTCLQTDTDSSGNPIGTCFQSCAQDVDGRGGCNDGYACDRANLACVPQCVVVDGVDSCQFAFEDHDTDPTTRETIIDEGAAFPSHCNTMTGLCETAGRAGATAGDDCMTDMDCEDDGFCMRGTDADTPVTLRDGYCIRLGCNQTDLACQAGDACTVSLFGLPGGVCMDGCAVGAETTDAQRHGLAGGNPGCGTGEACFWDGVSGTADAINGGCYPGNYNEIPAYNVGADCQDDGDCWSPFGRGRCLFTGGTFFDRTGHGICAVGGCGQAMDGTVGLLAADGIVTVPNPADVCQTASAGNNDLCVNFGDNNTFCVTSCTTAADCGAGYACPVLGGTALAPLRLCWPACQEDGDCHTGATCRNDAGAACNPDTDTCFCTDATPAPDAGAARDAGTDAFVAPDAHVATDAAMTDDAFAG